MNKRITIDLKNAADALSAAADALMEASASIEELEDKVQNLEEKTNKQDAFKKKILKALVDEEN